MIHSNYAIRWPSRVGGPLDGVGGPLDGVGGPLDGDPVHILSYALF